jgi:hypothetical protein
MTVPNTSAYAVNFFDQASTIDESLRKFHFGVFLFIFR